MRKIASVIIAVLMILSLCSCSRERTATIQMGNESSDQAVTSDEVSVSETSNDKPENNKENAASDSDDDSNGEFADEVIDNISVASVQAYTRFINNEEGLYFDKYSVAGLPSDTPYYLSEYMLARTDLFNEMNYEEIYSVSDYQYAYIDCGNDGVYELAISFTGKGSMSELEGDYYFIDVLKYIDGKLQLCYECCSHYRGYASINPFGVVYYGGSDFAGSNHYSDYTVIDGNGDYYALIGITQSTGDAIPGIYWGYDGEVDFTDFYPGEDLYEKVFIFKLYISYGPERGSILYSYEIADSSIAEEKVIECFSACPQIEWCNKDKYLEKLDTIFGYFGLTRDMAFGDEPVYNSFG